MAGREPEGNRAQDTGRPGVPAASSLLETHFLEPQNTGVLEGADWKVRIENPVCGDLLDLYVRRDSEQRIEACTFQVYGCPAAIAVGSFLSSSLQGRSLDDLAQFDQETISTAFGGIPAAQVHAAHLGADAVRELERLWRRGETE